MSADPLAILGPTCSWKSDTALIVAERLGAEILSCDSMQVYRGMDIGTGKPSRADRGRVRHHLIDCLDIEERCDAAAYVRLAEGVLADLEARGTPAVLAGGTGLYARSLIYGLGLLPADRGVAAEVEAELRAPGGEDALLAELERASPGGHVPDPVRRNPRRLVRAVEVVRLAGAPPWVLQPASGALPRRRFRQYVFLPDMAVLRPRIERRVTVWLREGWLDEVRGLVARGLLETPTARQALGYAEAAAFVAGRIGTLAELQERVVSATVRYARRQRTWFRHQHPGAVTIVIRRESSAEELAEVVLSDASAGESADRLGEAGGRFVVLE